jgi:hypothetical protein
LLCGLLRGSRITLEATTRDSKIRPSASTLANTDCSITKALVSLNLDLPSATVHRRHQGQHRIESEDHVFLSTSGWLMESLRKVLGEQRHGFCLLTTILGTGFICFPKSATVSLRRRTVGSPSKTTRKYEHAIEPCLEPVVNECNL